MVCYTVTVYPVEEEVWNVGWWTNKRLWILLVHGE